MVGAISLHEGLSPFSQRPCWTHTKRARLVASLLYFYITASCAELTAPRPPPVQCDYPRERSWMQRLGWWFRFLRLFLRRNFCGPATVPPRCAFFRMEGSLWADTRCRRSTAPRDSRGRPARHAAARRSLYLPLLLQGERWGPGSPQKEHLRRNPGHAINARQRSRIASAIACAACKAAFHGTFSFTPIEPDQSTTRTTFVCGACFPLMEAGIVNGIGSPRRVDRRFSLPGAMMTPHVRVTSQRFCS
jgi:hypothetical protein